MNAESRIHETIANYAALSVTRPDLIGMLRTDKPEQDATIVKLLKKAGFNVVDNKILKWMKDNMSEEEYQIESKNIRLMICLWKLILHHLSNFLILKVINYLMKRLQF